MYMAQLIKKIGETIPRKNSSGMNKARRAIIRLSTNYGIECLGIYKGFLGLMKHNRVRLDARFIANTINKEDVFLCSVPCIKFYAIKGKTQAYKNTNANNLNSLFSIVDDKEFIGCEN